MTGREAKEIPAPPTREAIDKAARRSFLKSFGKRWEDRRQRRARRKQLSATELVNQRSVRRRRKRKRTAFALGITALSMSSVSQMALSADPIAAELNADNPDYELFDPSERRHADKLTVSDKLLEAMVEEEGVRYDVYRDVAGYPTVGVGHLVLPQDDLRLGDTISHERAMKLLEQDLKKAERGVRELVGDLPINQHEFDALTDLVFNVGEGTVSERKSPRLNAAIEAGDYEGIAEELEYTTAKNKVANGLIYRSERRSQIFMAGDYSDPREERPGMNTA